MAGRSALPTCCQKVFVLTDNNLHGSDIISYFYCGYLISSWNQTHIWHRKLFPVFVIVLSFQINHAN
jgi:hypothetical protein